MGKRRVSAKIVAIPVVAVLGLILAVYLSGIVFAGEPTYTRKTIKDLADNNRTYYGQRIYIEVTGYLTMSKNGFEVYSIRDDSGHELRLVPFPNKDREEYLSAPYIKYTIQGRLGGSIQDNVKTLFLEVINIRRI